MVEEANPDLKVKEYCKQKHASKVAFICTKDNVLCCDDCAIEHSEHLDKLESIKSIFEVRLPQYRKLKDHLRVLAKMQISSDEIKSFIAQKLENSFDEIISKVMQMKNQWIDEYFGLIMKEINLDAEDENSLNFDELQGQVDQAFHKIHNFVNSEENGGSKELLELKIPEEFSFQIKELTNNLNSRKRYKKLDLEINFDPKPIKAMINIKGLENIRKFYSGSMLNPEDLSFVLSEFSKPIKKLNMLFSGKRDGVSAAIFHTKCDGAADTLVVARANGHVFGGYAKPEWNSNCVYSEDISNSSFLFTCRNKTKHSLLNPKHAIYGRTNYGPTFGGGHDWHIGNSNNGYTALGTTYASPPSGNCADAMSGTQHNCIFDDYEVHQIIFE